MKNQRIKQTEIKPLRERLHKAQKGLCCLCGHKMSLDEAVLDHDHETGHIRGVLHRQCNHTEGRIVSWIRRTGKHVEPIDFLERLTKYWKQDHTSKPVHPTHKSEQEKEIAVLKRKMKRLKTAKARQRYMLAIQNLENNNDAINGD